MTYTDYRPTGIKRIFNTDTMMMTLIVFIGLAIIASVAIPVYITLNRPTAGIIHDRTFTPAHDGTSCQRIGKVTTCRENHYADEYQFDLYNNDGKHGWVEVDANAYNTHTIGDYYNTKG